MPWPPPVTARIFIALLRLQACRLCEPPPGHDGKRGAGLRAAGGYNPQVQTWRPAAMPVTVRPVTSAVGAELSGVDLSRLSAGEFAEVEAAWNRYSVIVLRGQRLSDDDLLAFSRRFG